MVESLFGNELLDGSRNRRVVSALTASRRSKLKREATAANNGVAGARSEWFGAGVDEVAAAQAGIKLRGGGLHQSKTMMLAELSTLSASGDSARHADAILRENLLGRPSVRAREAALVRLRQLYGITPKTALFVRSCDGSGCAIRQVGR